MAHRGGRGEKGRKGGEEEVAEGESEMPSDPTWPTGEGRAELN